MKIFFILIGLNLFSFSVSAKELATIEQNLNHIVINLRMDSITKYCHLEATELSIRSPQYHLYNDQFRVNGEISVTFKQNQKRICLTARNPEGRIKLKKGRSLPKIKSGFYRIMVNNRVIASTFQISPSLEEDTE